MTSTTTTIKLPSSSTTGQSYPVAVMDSGGYQVLMGDQSLVDSIYDVFGGSQGPVVELDGSLMVVVVDVLANGTCPDGHV
jgi:hypothetical protein